MGAMKESGHKESFTGLKRTAIFIDHKRDTIVDPSGESSPFAPRRIGNIANMPVSYAA